jgi:hypothetical protein
MKIKREKAEENARPRKVARPMAGDTQLEVDDEGNTHELSISTLAAREVMEIED